MCVESECVQCVYAVCVCTVTVCVCKCTVLYSAIYRMQQKIALM